MDLKIKEFNEGEFSIKDDLITKDTLLWKNYPRCPFRNNIPDINKD